MQCCRHLKFAESWQFAALQLTHGAIWPCSSLVQEELHLQAAVSQFLLHFLQLLGCIRSFIISALGLMQLLAVVLQSSSHAA